jgi:hypothetical protein
MTSRGSRAAEPFGGWGPPPRPSRLSHAAPAGAAVVVLAGAVVATLLLTGSNGGHKRGTPPSQPSTPVTAARTVAEVSALVAQSAADRTSVIAAIDGVQNCSLGVQQGEDTVEAVINDRRQAVMQLTRMAGTRQLDRLANGAALVSELTTTLNAAISDDESYMSWMGDVATGHAQCGGDPMADPNFAAAQAQSTRTNIDKEAFVRDWNSLASQFGQATYRAQDF